MELTSTEINRKRRRVQHKLCATILRPTHVPEKLYAHIDHLGEPLPLFTDTSGLFLIIDGTQTPLPEALSSVNADVAAAFNTALAGIHKTVYFVAKEFPHFKGARKPEQVLASAFLREYLGISGEHNYPETNDEVYLSLVGRIGRASDDLHGALHLLRDAAGVEIRTAPDFRYRMLLTYADLLTTHQKNPFAYRHDGHGGAHYTALSETISDPDIEHLGLHLGVDPHKNIFIDFSGTDLKRTPQRVVRDALTAAGKRAYRRKVIIHTPLSGGARTDMGGFLAEYAATHPHVIVCLDTGSYKALQPTDTE